jgi:hypothetical protein
MQYSTNDNYSHRNLTVFFVEVIVEMPEEGVQRKNAFIDMQDALFT